MDFPTIARPHPSRVSAPANLDPETAKELTIAMQIYMMNPEVCRVAAADGSKIAQHIEEAIKAESDEHAGEGR